MASVRMVDGGMAERVADNGNVEEYPCSAQWEVTDEKLLGRLCDRIRAGEQLTTRQCAWYLARLTFRNVPIPADVQQALYVA